MSTSILDNLDTVAVLSAGLFAGTALYMTIGQIPAFRAFGLDEYWRFFAHVYVRAAISQAAYTATAGIAGILHGTRIIGSPFYRNLWIAAGSTFLAIIPYTLVFLVPINRIIINDNKLVKSGSESKINLATKNELIDKWITLHFVRTVASIAGFGAMVFGLSRHSSFVFTW